ncbi:unnamed protein product [Penicillium roqueforti FM164]|uniref:Genomic scaffold, ProqFM164S03 n=1 Tax=Penicillium roqueforti (strain FM164) TaxID=1365484 RepID=W6QBP4_PENRF|nr:unnamed protein product [Penicillium roqueforti FM164]
MIFELIPHLAERYSPFLPRPPIPKTYDILRRSTGITRIPTDSLYTHVYVPHKYAIL